MNEDIFSIIEYKMPTFSKGQKRIAKLIIEECDKAAFMTASGLGKAAGVSEATVVRFAAELGYGGYPKMQRAMQERVLNRLTASEWMDMAEKRSQNADVLSSVLQWDHNRLRKLEQTLDRAAFFYAVEDIRKARNIYIIATRSSSALAQYLGYYLQYMFPGVHIISSCAPGEALEQLIYLTSDDAAIAFSFPRHPTAVLQAAAYCRSAGAAVVGITGGSMSPLAEHCDHLLTVDWDMVSIVDSLAAPMSLVNALIVALASGRETVLRQSIEKLESIWQTYPIYEIKDGSR